MPKQMGTATASVAPHSRTAAPCLVADRVTPRDQLRWIAEQTFGDLQRYRRLQVDHEGSTGMSRTMTLLAVLFMTGARFERQIMA
jgi:transposase